MVRCNFETVPRAGPRSEENPPGCAKGLQPESQRSIDIHQFWLSIKNGRHLRFIWEITNDVKRALNSWLPLTSMIQQQSLSLKRGSPTFNTPPGHWMTHTWVFLTFGGTFLVFLTWVSQWLSAPLAGNRTARKLQNFSQKVKKFSTFRFFRLFEQKSPGMWPCRLFAKSQKVKKFSTFRIFHFFRLFEQKSPGMWTFRLFGWNFSTTVGVWIAKSEKPSQNFKHVF